MGNRQDSERPAAAASEACGKRLAEIQEVRNHATGKASEIARHSAFASIAAIWILTKEASEPFPRMLLASMVFLIAGLLADFLQYAYNSFLWRDFYNEKFEHHKNDDALIDIPDNLSKETYRFFKLKIVLFALGFVALIVGAIGCIRVV